MPTANKLTYKRKLFSEEYVRRKGNGTQAALAVYDTESPKIAQAIASENLSLPVVQATIEEIARKQGITQDTILSKFATIASKEPEKWTGDTILRATQDLAKMLRMYPASKHTTLNVSFKGKLKEMKYQDLKSYVEGMRSKNDELIKEAEEMEAPQSEPDVVQ